jgi:predicted nucleotidyltransferase component of viral defense system
MNLEVSVHRNVLLQILKDLYTDRSIAPCLGLKGGTAAHLYYHLDRFSVDLDFDLLELNREDLVFTRVAKVIEPYGTIKEATRKRSSLFYHLSYADKAHNIKVDISRRPCDSKFELKTHLGVSMLVMVRQDMFAHKLMALYERGGRTSRDIYDVWFFLKHNWPINLELVERRAGLSFRQVAQRCVETLEALPNRRVLAGIGELLTSRQKEWARAKLRTETIFLLKLRLGEES